MTVIAAFFYIDITTLQLQRSIRFNCSDGWYITFDKEGWNHLKYTANGNSNQTKYKHLNRSSLNPSVPVLFAMYFNRFCQRRSFGRFISHQVTGFYSFVNIVNHHKNTT